MAKEKTINYARFQKEFGTEESCRDFLASHRWSNRYICPVCGCKEYYYLSNRNLYQCKGCRNQQSLTARTVMHRSHLPLQIWFWAIFLISRDKRGYSVAMLSRDLDLPYNTAWFLLHRIRETMSQREARYKLSGIVELDDTYFGKPEKGGKRGAVRRQRLWLLFQKALMASPYISKCRLFKILRVKPSANSHKVIFMNEQLYKPMHTTATENLYLRNTHTNMRRFFLIPKC